MKNCRKILHRQFFVNILNHLPLVAGSCLRRIKNKRPRLHGHKAGVLFLRKA